MLPRNNTNASHRFGTPARSLCRPSPADPNSGSSTLEKQLNFFLLFVSPPPEIQSEFAAQQRSLRAFAAEHIRLIEPSAHRFALRRILSLREAVLQWKRAHPTETAAEETAFIREWSEQNPSKGYQDEITGDAPGDPEAADLSGVPPDVLLENMTNDQLIALGLAAQSDVAAKDFAMWWQDETVRQLIHACRPAREMTALMPKMCGSEC